MDALNGVLLISWLVRGNVIYAGHLGTTVNMAECELSAQQNIEDYRGRGATALGCLTVNGRQVEVHLTRAARPTKK